MREHADNCEDFSVQRDGFAEDSRISAEKTFPEAVGDDGDASGTEFVFSRLKRAAQRGWNANDIEEVCGNKSAANSSGLFTPGEG